MATNLSNASLPAVIDNIWVYFSGMINAGNANDITLPIAFKNSIGQKGVEMLADRFE